MMVEAACGRRSSMPVPAARLTVWFTLTPGAAAGGAAGAGAVWTGATGVSVVGAPCASADPADAAERTRESTNETSAVSFAPSP